MQETIEATSDRVQYQLERRVDDQQDTKTAKIAET